jgi:outer membrane protein TolC
MKKQLITYTAKLFAIMAFSLSVSAQDAVHFQFADFMQRVKEHHPMARQADIQMELGAVKVQSSRGSFDPKIKGNLNQKYFDEQKYYSLLDGGLVVPTWFGIELKAGHERNEGVYLNPENQNPEDGLYYAGISIPIGQGLFIDERRAELRKAQLYAKGTKAKRDYLTNQLLFEAATAYWKWFQAYYNFQLYEQAYTLADERFRAVQKEALSGNIPTIDTVEAGIQLQNRSLALEDGKLALKNAKAELAIYLWEEGYVPLELAESSIPEAKENTDFSFADPQWQMNIDSLIAKHPQMQLNRLEWEQIEIDRRLSIESLKPQLNLNYNPLTEAIGTEAFNNYSQNNYKWGVSVSMPLFLRKERAALTSAKLKQEEVKLSINNEGEQLRFQAKAYLNQWTTTFNQIGIYRQTTEDYKRLLEGEKNLFQNGESSLFMVNSRETSYINSILKLNELMSKNQISEWAAYYYLGILLNQLED